MDTRILLCTDLDRTLIPNGPEPESPEARERFARLVSRDGICLAYVSGRHKALVAEAIEDYALPLPKYLIGDVGTTVYALNGKPSPSEWTPWPEWEAEIAPDWAGHRQDGLKKMFEDLNDLRLQEDKKQNNYKLSYYVGRNVDRDRVDRILRGRLADCGLRAALIWSVDIAADLGLLDLVPAGATKYHAIDFLMRRLNYAIEKTLFAGDSGNDLEVLVSPIPAVLVANALPEVREAARIQAERLGTRQSLYFAEGGFLGMNGNYAAGLLEGLAHFLPETQAWMQAA